MKPVKTVYYAAASLDGFIADVNESVAWLDKLAINQQETGADSFFETVDGILMGRKTYDFVYHYGQWPYENKPTWVCSSREIPLIKGCNLQREREPQAAIQQAQRLGVANLWVVGGGRLVSSLIQSQLLTHISVSVMPVLLGEGIHLVHTLPSHLYLHQEAATSMSGFTQIEYRIDL